MRCWKMVALALATFTISSASFSPERLADLLQIEEVSVIENTNISTQFHLHPRDFKTASLSIPSQLLADSDQTKEFSTIERTNTSMHSHLYPRDFKKEDKAERNRREWRDLFWPMMERRHWPAPVLHDFQSIIMPHLPPGIKLPSPLLPTNNETLMQNVYVPAAAIAQMEEMKWPSQKKMELATLKRNTKNFMLASRCLHLKDCKTYYWDSVIEPELWDTDIDSGKKYGMAGTSFKQNVYDHLAAEVSEQTMMEAWVDLGKQLKVLGFPFED